MTTRSTFVRIEFLGFSFNFSSTGPSYADLFLQMNPSVDSLLDSLISSMVFLCLACLVGLMFLVRAHLAKQDALLRVKDRQIAYEKREHERYLQAWRDSGNQFMAYQKETVETLNLMCDER